MCDPHKSFLQGLIQMECQTLLHNQWQPEFLIQVLELQDLPLLVLPLRVVRRWQHVFCEFHCQRLLCLGGQDKHIQKDSPSVVPQPNVVIAHHYYQLQQTRQVQSLEQKQHRQYLAQHFRKQQPNQFQVFQVLMGAHHVDHELHTRFAHP